jgi:hypothetical protein
MIRSIRHRGLKRLYEDGDPRGVIAEHAVKLRDILGRLDAARAVADMDMPGFLPGSEKWSTSECAITGPRSDHAMRHIPVATFTVPVLAPGTPSRSTWFCGSQVRLSFLIRAAPDQSSQRDLFPSGA